MQYKSPISSGKKVMAKVKVFFKIKSNFKVKVLRSNITVPSQIYCHKEYTCAI